MYDRKPADSAYEAKRKALTVSVTVRLSLNESQLLDDIREPNESRPQCLRRLIKAAAIADVLRGEKIIEYR